LVIYIHAKHYYATLSHQYIPRAYIISMKMMFCGINLDNADSARSVRLNIE